MIGIMKTHLYYYHDYWSLQGLEAQGLQVLEEEPWQGGTAYPLAAAAWDQLPAREPRGWVHNVPWPPRLWWVSPGDCEGRAPASSTSTQPGSRAGPRP